MNITKNKLKQIIKEEIENLQENPYAEDNPYGEEDENPYAEDNPYGEEGENPLVRAANDALFDAVDKVEQLVFAMDDMDENEKKTLYRGRVTMSDVKYKMDQLKRLLG
jgi:hypothetical protein